MIILTTEALEGYNTKTELPYPKDSPRAKGWLFGRCLELFKHPEPKEVKLAQSGKIICDGREFFFNPETKVFMQCRLK